MRQIAYCAVFAALVASAFSASIDQSPNDVKDQDIRISLLEDGYNKEDSISAKQALKNLTTRWPRGIVYYQWDPVTNYTPAEKRIILEGFSWISSRTCVRFVEDRNNWRHLLIHGRFELCRSDGMGYKGVTQYLNLWADRKNGGGCMVPRLIAHEAMHVLGIDHEQNRPDRDNYIKVLKENVREEYEHNFDLNTNTTTYGLPYDFSSIMHYAYDTYSKNGQATMVSIVPGFQVPRHENWPSLSRKDVALVNKMYCSPSP